MPKPAWQDGTSAEFFDARHGISIDDALRGHEQGSYVAIVACRRANGDLSFPELLPAYSRKRLAQVGLEAGDVLKRRIEQ
jgi:hypothetical protein